MPIGGREVDLELDRNEKDKELNQEEKKVYDKMNEMGHLVKASYIYDKSTQNAVDFLKHSYPQYTVDHELSTKRFIVSKNNENNNVVVAVRGTDPSQEDDLISDLSIFTGTHNTDSSRFWNTLQAGMGIADFTKYSNFGSIAGVKLHDWVRNKFGLPDVLRWGDGRTTEHISDFSREYLDDLNNARTFETTQPGALEQQFINQEHSLFEPSRPPEMGENLWRTPRGIDLRYENREGGYYWNNPSRNLYQRPFNVEGGGVFDRENVVSYPTSRVPDYKNIAKGVGVYALTKNMDYFTGLTGRLRDMDNVYNAIQRKYPNHKIVSAGHSLGGFSSSYLGDKYGIEGHHLNTGSFIFDRLSNLYGDYVAPYSGEELVRGGNPNQTWYSSRYKNSPKLTDVVKESAIMATTLGVLTGALGGVFAPLATAGKAALYGAGVGAGLGAYRSKSAAVDLVGWGSRRKKGNHIMVQSEHSYNPGALHTVDNFVNFPNLKNNSLSEHIGFSDVAAFFNSFL